jgi:hypothetical protein
MAHRTGRFCSKPRLITRGYTIPWYTISFIIHDDPLIYGIPTINGTLTIDMGSSESSEPSMLPQPLFITECNMTSQVSTMRSPQTVHKDVAWHTKSHQTATTYDLGTFPPPIPSHPPLKKMGFSLISHPAIGILLL